MCLPSACGRLIALAAASGENLAMLFLRYFVFIFQCYKTILQLMGRPSSVSRHLFKNSSSPLCTPKSRQDSCLANVKGRSDWARCDAAPSGKWQPVLIFRGKSSAVWTLTEISVLTFSPDPPRRVLCVRTLIFLARTATEKWRHWRQLKRRLTMTVVIRDGPLDWTERGGVQTVDMHPVMCSVACVWLCG